MNPLVLSILSAMAAALWSVWTWSEEQKKERQLKRDRGAALYVNPLILATEDLRSLLYRILAEDELAFYKKQYPAQYEFGSPAAIEILYRLSQFFGWSYRTWRYGPYTRDPRVISLTREIMEDWESRAFPGDAFHFSFDEKISLDSSALIQVGFLNASAGPVQKRQFCIFRGELLQNGSSSFGAVFPCLFLSL